MQRPFLIGERLYLRAVEVADGPLLAGWVTHPDVRPHLRRSAPLNLVQEERFIREVCSAEGAHILVIALREGDRPIGVVGLHDLDPTTRGATLGISIGEPDCWSRGYGAEAIALLLDHAFLRLNLHRVGLEVHVDNPRGIACYAKLGFVEEGRLREAHFSAGRYQDKLLMSVLQREWLARREGLAPEAPAAAPAGDHRRG